MICYCKIKEITLPHFPEIIGNRYKFDTSLVNTLILPKIHSNTTAAYSNRRM
jgi:hypothetical protein